MRVTQSTDQMMDQPAAGYPSQSKPGRRLGKGAAKDKAERWSPAKRDAPGTGVSSLANPTDEWRYVQLAGFCRQFRKSSNSPFLAPSRNASNSCSVYERTGPPGFLESASIITVPCRATWTQLSAPLLTAVRHIISSEGDWESDTVSPFRMVVQGC